MTKIKIGLAILRTRITSHNLLLFREIIADLSHIQENT